MPITSPPAVDALPAAPSTSSPSTFDALADAFIAALATFRAQLNTLATWMQTTGGEVLSAANTASSAAALSQAALDAGLADAASNASSAAASAASAQAAWTAALAANPDLDPAVRMNPSTITADITIPTHYNAYSAGPLTIGEGAEVTLNDHSNWSVL